MSLIDFNSKYGRNCLNLAYSGSVSLKAASKEAKLHVSLLAASKEAKIHLWVAIVNQCHTG